MSTPNCPLCKGTTFELKEIKVKNSNFRLNGICCSHCGAVLSVAEFFNVTHLIKKLAEKLNVDI
jgi:hypothetical protein